MPARRRGRVVEQTGNFMHLPIAGTPSSKPESLCEISTAELFQTFVALILSQLWRLVELDGERHRTSRIASPIKSTSEEDFVKKLAFVAAAAVLALTLPASAQGVSVGVGDARIGVGVDRPHHHHG